MAGRLDWRGAQTREQVIAAVIDGLTEFGLTHETAAKSKLQPGRGVVTSTLRRSIHAADPAYNFASDDVPATPGSPERSGSGGGAAHQGSTISIVVGSGMVYARAIEELYAYMMESFQEVAPRLADILGKHAGRRGLR